jgi:putative ABC transport system permease protein
MTPPNDFGAPRDGAGDDRTADRVARELAFHIEMRTRELIARGVNPDEARRQATDRFGDLPSVVAELRRLDRQTDRAVRRTRYIGEVIQDARFALRVLARRRTFAALAVGTLGLGIGAATAIYSVVDGVLLRPLPFPDPDRIVAVWITQPALEKDPTMAWLADGTPMGNREYQALRRSVPSLRDLAMWGSDMAMLTTPNNSEQLRTWLVTSSLLPALGLRPALGRGFVAGEDALGGPNVAMVSWEAWLTRFGGDSSLVGRSITLNDQPYTVVGVLPPDVRIDRTIDAPPVWVPALRGASDIPERRNRNYHALARLAPGATVERATRETARVLREVTGDTMLSARVDVWQRDQGRDARGALLLLLGAAGVLLLIACVNVAILELGEASGRARELAARAALGAGVGRLVRQLLVESLVIALVSAVLGTAVAWALMRGLIVIAPDRLPGIDTVTMDGRVLAFAVMSATATGLLFGIVPALVAGRAGAASLVRTGAGQSGRGTRQLQRTLVAAQLALSMVLLVAATLLGRSLNELSAVDPGFRPARLTALRASLPRSYTNEQIASFTMEAIRRLAAVPGLQRVTAGSQAPFDGTSSSSPVTIEPVPGTEARAGRHTQQRYVVPGFFETLGIRLVAGRVFDAGDRAGAEPVAILSEAEVRRDFGGQLPLGRRVKHQAIWRRVVGVVADIKYHGLAREDEATIYIPYDQFRGSWPAFIVRSNAEAAVMPAFKRILKELEPRAVAELSASIPARIEKSYAAERYRTMLVTAFGAMAALLAAVGLYGVSVRSASRRTREIGIRLALGGTRAMLVRLLVGDAMSGVMIGLLIGLPGALLAGRLVAPYLFKVTPRDPTSFLVVSVLLVAVTAVASFLPARLASRSNPAVVLRGE